MDKKFLLIYSRLKKKYPLWSTKKLVYVIHKLMKSEG